MRIDQHTSHSLEETQKIAAEWLASISKKYFGDADRDQALVVGLSGHLGAGKTAFVKAVAKELGVDEEVTSPTFVIMKIYDLAPKDALKDLPWKRLIHIDAYRLEKGEELTAIGWKGIIADRANLVMVEWPENVGLKSPSEQMRLRFESDNDIHSVSF